MFLFRRVFVLSIQFIIFQLASLLPGIREGHEKVKPEQETRQTRCDNCRKQIDFGNDLITTEKCVYGPRGIVPLGEIKKFCSDKCVKAWFSDDPAEGLPEVRFRIP